MTLNIAGEIIKLKVDFDEQNDVRDAERAVKLYLDRLKKAMPEQSDRNLLAMAAFQFADWFNRLNKIQDLAIETALLKSSQIDLALSQQGLLDENMIISAL